MNSQHVASSVISKAASRHAVRHIWYRTAATASSKVSTSHAALGSAVTSSGHYLTFASPESDFASATIGKAQSQNTSAKKRDYSSIAAAAQENYSLTSPDNDFIVSSLPKCHVHQYSTSPHLSWSNTITYASPESDFSSESLKERANRIWDESRPGWSETLSFSTPESDFASSTTTPSESLEDAADRVWHQNEEAMTSMAYALSYASPESDFTSPQIYALLTEQQKRQLDHCDEASSAAWTHASASALAEYDTRRDLLDDHAHEVVEEPAAKEDQFHFEEIYAKTDAQGPLPTTLHEAELVTDQAIVITESAVPFRIVRVNEAWEGLCGYTQDEARGKTLGDLLQGPETDVGAATALVDKLLNGMEAGAVLTNYAKGGRKFQNRIRVGTLKNQSEKVTHFVGVLKEIHEMNEKIVGGQSKDTQMA